VPAKKAAEQPHRRRGPEIRNTRSIREREASHQCVRHCRINAIEQASAGHSQNTGSKPHMYFENQLADLGLLGCRDVRAKPLFPKSRSGCPSFFQLGGICYVEPVAQGFASVLLRNGQRISGFFALKGCRPAPAAAAFGNQLGRTRAVMTKASTRTQALCPERCAFHRCECRSRPHSGSFVQQLLKVGGRG